ncbi:MAG TPA: M48 family metalloprotease [Methylomirabilota bacterium]|jgi:predicted Zn-dependent protease
MELTRREWSRGLIAAAAMLSAGCGTISPARERELGRGEAEEIERTMGLVQEPRVLGYVRQVGARLAEAAQRSDISWEFSIADDASANAFALPGGWCYVTRGLLVLLNSEDELAGVLGHEMAHVLERHAVRRAEAATPFAVLFGVPAAILGTVSPTVGDIVSGTGRLASGAALASYTRDQEREADDRGIALAARAGWDPRGLARALRTMEREDALAGKDPGRVRFFASHPTAPERVARIEAAALAPTKTATPPARARDAFVRRLDGLVVGDNPAIGVFVGSRFVHPELDVALEMPARWKTLKSREAAGALAPDGDAAMIVHAVTAGDDPVAGAKADGLGEASLKQLKRRQIASLPAAGLVANTRDGDRVTLTWIAHRHRIIRVTGIAKGSAWDRHGGTLERATESFRPLRSSDREPLVHSRLRIRPAGAGETVAQVLGRGGGTWDAAQMAVANGTTQEARLDAGWPVKVPVAERYVSAGGA